MATPSLPVQKLIKTCMLLAPVLAAAVGLGRSVAVSADRQEETARELKETKRKVERLDSQREESRVQLTDVQAELRGLKDGMDRIERRLGTK